MKRMLIGAAAIICLLVHPYSSLSDDAWSKYEKFSKQFYFLSEQSFDKIECQITLPEIEKVINKQAIQLKTEYGGASGIKIDISEFRMTYSRNGGLTFNQPTIDIKVASEDSIKDKEKFENGKQLLINGFNQTIKSTIRTIKGVFDNYIRPDKSKITLESVDLSGNKAKLKYVQADLNVTRVCEKSRCVTASKNDQMDIQSEEDYVKVGDKLAIQSGSANAKQSGSDVHVKIDVEYQRVKNIFFPSRIASEIKIQSSGTNTEGKFDIRFKNVKVQ